jgi:small subunit ribosomal protein S20
MLWVEVGQRAPLALPEVAYTVEGSCMPHTRSAKKRLRQNEKRRMRNRTTIKAIKTQIKKVHTLAESGDLEALRSACTLAVKKLDKAASRRIVHPNLASRKKSQLARLLHGKEKAAKPPQG